VQGEGLDNLWIVDFHWRSTGGFGKAGRVLPSAPVWLWLKLTA
jgi:hypothetical protein